MSTPGTTERGAAPSPLGKWYGLVAVAAVVAVVLDRVSDTTVTIQTDEFVLFGIFYIVAQASERLVEPLMQTVAPQTKDLKAAVGDAKTRLNQTLAAAVDDADAVSAATEDVQEKKQALTDRQGQRAIIAWALASAFALVACGLLGLGLIGAVSTVEAEGDWDEVFASVDVVVTGLAVGAGTKPLHDLITRIEKSKEKADTATDAAV